MKKLVNIVKSFELVILLWVVTCTTLAVLRILDYTDCSWWWIASPLYVPFMVTFVFLVVSWLVGFFVLIAKDFYGRYNHMKARRLAKQIEKDIEKLEKEL